MSAFEAHDDEEGFRAPCFDDPVHLEAHIAAVPSGALAKGLFFADMIERARASAPEVDIVAAAGVGQRRYLPVLDYPYTDWLRLTVAAAQAIYPNEPLGEGLRRIGRTAFGAFFETLAGRLIFDALGRNVERVLLNGPKAYSVILNFGRVFAERMGPRHIHFHFRGLPGFLETYQVGVFEGAVDHFGGTGSVRVRIRDIADGTLDVRWE